MRKGFTLVELLAVIVILAIIALITVPIIMNVVESSRKSSATSSAYGYIKGVNITYANELLLGNNFELEGTLLVDENGNIDGHKVDVEGTTIKGGYLTYNNGKITEGCLTIGDYKVTIENDTAKETIKGACEVKEIEPEEESSPIEWFTFKDNSDGTATITGFSDKYDIALQNNEEGVHDIVIPSKSDTDKDVTIVGGIFQKVDEDSCDYNEDEDYICNVKYSLNSIYLPDSIIEISDGSLSGLHLKNVRLDSKLQKIGNYAFSYSSDYLDDNVDFYDLEGDYNEILEIIIPNSVTTIGDSAFCGNNLTSVDLGNGVQTIGDYAFSYNNLTSVSIPSSVKYLSGFDGNNLTEINIPEGVTTIGNDAFYENNLTSVTIPESVTTIGNDAFPYNNLTRVDLGSGVQSIGYEAFYSNNLTSVTIPESVTTIGNYAFSDNNLESVDLGTGVQTIGEHAFYKYKNSFYKSNPSLTKIINKTGKAFNWGYIVNGSSGYTFIKGTIENSAGNVEVTNGEE